MRIGLLLFCFFCIQNLAIAAQDKETKQITQVIQNYGKAMSNSNVEGVLALFTEDAIFFPSGHATAMGKAAVKAAYQSEFATIDLDITVAIDEILHQGDLAYARSRSLGHLTIKATGEKKSTKDYRAFFLLRKIENKWKITHFTFNFASKG